jgi:hypothetical protein
MVRYWSISPAVPMTPKVSVSGGSCGGVELGGPVGDVVVDDPVEGPVEGPVESDDGDDDVEPALLDEEPEESHPASRPLVSSAAAARASLSRLLPDRARTAETLVVEDKNECAGPGAPHGAWPLEAADVGTRGCRGPAHSDHCNEAGPRGIPSSTARPAV